MWAGGLAAATAVVSWWRIVGPGFVWLAGGVTAVLAAGAAWAGGGAAAWVATALAVLGMLLAKVPPASALAYALAAVGLVVAGIPDGGVAATLSGALALGAVTAEMMLGHWYLVDPRLPRWALRRLDLAAAIGVVVDVVVLIALGALDWSGGDAILGWTFLVLAAFSLVLLVGVWFSLREPTYSGVMAATGLSYLAVLTVFGSSVVGRALLDPDSTVGAG